MGETDGRRFNVVFIVVDYYTEMSCSMQ